MRLHDGPAAGELAHSVAARAFTYGDSIVFGARQYLPGTPEGRRLIAHELTHVVQQQPAIARQGPAPRAVARQTALQIFGNPAAVPPVAGMSLSAFKTYTQQEADWFVEPSLTQNDRDDLWGLLLKAQGDHIVSGVGDMQLSELRTVTAAQWTPLEAFCRGTHSSGQTVRLFFTPPMPLADRIALGTTILAVEAVIPGPVLELTVSHTQIVQVQTQALTARLADYWTNFQPHLEQTFVPAPAAAGPEFQRVLNFLTTIGPAGLAPLMPLRGATPAERWVRNLHRFPVPMLTRLVTNLGVRTGAKRLILVLFSGHDAAAAFQDATGLFATLVTASPNNLVLMIEGATTLADITARIPTITTTWGQIVGGVRRISQVLIAGHGSPTSIQMAGTSAPVVAGDSVSYTPQALTVGDPATQALLDALLTHMPRAAARILYYGCLVGASHVAEGTASAAIPGALAASQSLGAFTETRAAAAGVAPHRVQAARASVAIGDVTSLFNAAGNLVPTYPLDAQAYSTAVAYAPAGREPEGVLRAAVEVGATNAVTAETLLRTRLALAPQADWYDAITRLLVGIVLPPVAGGGLNLQMTNDLANIAEVPFLVLWPQFHISAASFSTRVNPQPYAATIYAGIAARTEYSAPADDDEKRLRIVVDQGRLALNGAAEIPTFLSGMLLSAFTADTVQNYLDPGILAPHGAALLPPAGPFSVERIRLALAWFALDPANADVRAFLRAQVNQPPNAPAAFTPAVSAEIAAALGTDRTILDALGFAAVAMAPPPLGGGAAVPFANLALPGSASRTLLLTGRPYLATVTAAPNVIVRNGPAPADRGIMALSNGANVRVMGLTGTAAAVDVFGRLGFVQQSDISAPPP